MTHDIRDFISHYQTCQQVKPPSPKLGGLLQPLSIPSMIWEDISMDFVTSLPTVVGKSVIVVVVVRLSKYCHLGILSMGYTTTVVTDYFIHQIVCLHGLPKTIVFDCDKIFMSKFWKELIHRSGTTLNLSSTYHLETDG